MRARRNNLSARIYLLHMAIALTVASCTPPEEASPQPEPPQEPELEAVLRVERPDHFGAGAFTGVTEHPMVRASIDLLRQRWQLVERQLDRPLASADRDELEIRVAHIIGRCLSQCALGRQCDDEKIEFDDPTLESPQRAPEAHRLDTCHIESACVPLLTYPEAIAMRAFDSDCWRDESELWACREGNACSPRDTRGETRACFELIDELHDSRTCYLDGRELKGETPYADPGDYMEERLMYMAMAMLGEAFDPAEFLPALTAATEPYNACLDKCQKQLHCAAMETYGQEQPADALQARACYDLCAEFLESSIERFTAIYFRAPECLSAMTEVERCQRDLSCELHLERDRSSCVQALFRANTLCSVPLASLRPMPAPIPREALERREPVEDDSAQGDTAGDDNNPGD